MINTGYKYDNCYKAPNTLDILFTESVSLQTGIDIFDNTDNW